jgi:hypothetical protein
VRQHHTLGRSGAPGGVEERGQVRRDRVSGARLRPALRHGGEIGAFAFEVLRRTSEHELRRPRSGVASAHRDARERPLAEEELRAAVVEDVRKAVVLGLCVDHHERAARKLNAEDGRRARQRVLHEDGRAVTALQPFVLQRGGDGERTREQLGERRAAVLGRDCDLRGMRLGRRNETVLKQPLESHCQPTTTA